jgi:hypothetical protein
MAQKMNATLPHRSNAPVTPFAEETKKVTKKVRQTVDEDQIKALEEAQAAQAGEEQSAAETETPKTLTLNEQRQALKDAGFKRCPSHLRLLDRLPEAQQQPVEGHPVEIRPISEFQKNTSTCRHCDHLIQRDWRAEHKAPASTARQEATLARLIVQRDALNVRIDAMRDAQAGSIDTTA